MSNVEPNLRRGEARHRLVRGVGWVIALATFAWGAAALWMMHPAAGVSYTIACVALARFTWRSGGSPAVVLLAAVAVMLGWSAVSARNDRHWTPDTAQIAWAEISGDTVTLHNYRNFEWRTESDFTPRWETKAFRLSQLNHVDFVMTYWGSPHVCHTMLTFDFGPDGRVCASIEARREQGEEYSGLAGIFRRYELAYVLGDERDIVRLRTRIRPNNDVYLFRLNATPELARTLFQDYLRSANALREKPRWYHTLLTNCSTTLRSHFRRAQVSDPWDWRVLANGYADEHLYKLGYVTRDLPLPELKRRSRINPAALAADDSPDFSNLIRAGLPGF